MESVFEWVNDWYQDPYPNAGQVVDPVGPSSSPYKVRRGGSLVSFNQFVESASRIVVGLMFVIRRLVSE